MRTNIYQLKKHIPLLSLSVLLSFFSHNTFAAIPAVPTCKETPGGLQPFDFGGLLHFECATQPENQFVIFYKAYVCTATTFSAPTTGTAFDLSSCQKIFDAGAGGSEINVSLGTTVGLTGTVTIPPPGTYNSLVLEMDPRFTYALQGGFIRADGVTPLAMTSNEAVPTTGPKCWTNGTNSFTNTANNRTATCGAAVPATFPKPSSYTINGFGNPAAPPAFIATAPDMLQPDGSSFSAALVNATNMKLITLPAQDAQNPANTRLLGYGTNRLVTTAVTKSFTVQITNSLGVGAQIQPTCINTGAPATSCIINGVITGPFNISLQAK